MINKVLIQGRLVDAPQIIETASGVRVGTFTIANSIPYKDKETGEWKEIVNFFDVKAFNGRNQKVQRLQKGDMVLIEGKLQQDKWQKDGKTFVKIWIIAENMQILKKVQSKPNTDTKVKKQSEEELLKEVENTFLEEDLPIEL